MKQLFNKFSFVFALVAISGSLYMYSLVMAGNVDEKNIAPTETNVDDTRTGQYYYDTNGAPINPNDAAYDPMIDAGGGSNPTTTTSSGPTTTGRGTTTTTTTTPSGSTTTGRGTTTTTTTTTTTPIDEVNFTVALDKNSYTINDAMVLTASAMMSVSLSYVPDILITAGILNSPNAPQNVIDNTNGGKNLSNSVGFAAPAVAGNYTMRVNITQSNAPTYIPGNFILYDSSLSPIASKTFTAWAYMKNTLAKGDTVTITTNANGEVVSIDDPQSVSPMDISVMSTYYYLVDTTTQEKISIEQNLIQVAGTTTLSKTLDIPFEVKNPVTNPNTPIVTGPSVMVWTNSDCNYSNQLFSDRSDNKKIKKGTGTIVCWEALGLGKDAYCTSPQQPVSGKEYKTVDYFYTPVLYSTEKYVVNCQDKVVDINDAIGSPNKGNTGSTSSGGSSCFITDTLVTLVNGSQKNIQDVKIGDILKGEKTNNKVIGFHQPKLGDKKLYSFNGGKYFVTAEHPFKTISGWKSINPELTLSENIGITVTELKVGDTLITDKGNILLKTIDSKNDAAGTQLYNFLLNGDHTYYADGYLVHNKYADCSTGVCGTAGPTAGSDPGLNSGGGAAGGGYSCYSTYTKGFPEYNCSVGDKVNGNVMSNK